MKSKMLIYLLVLFFVVCFVIIYYYYYYYIMSNKPICAIAVFNDDNVHPVFRANSLLGAIFCILYILRAFNIWFDFLFL